MNLRDVLQAATSETWTARLVLFIAIIVTLAIVFELSQWLL